MTDQLSKLDGFSLHVTVYIKPEDVEKFYEAMRPVYDAVASEPECLFFEIYQDPTNLGIISWVENWSKSPEWMMTISKEYYKPYFAVTEPMYIKPREFKILKRLHPYVSAKKEDFQGAFVGDYRG